MRRNIIAFCGLVCIPIIWVWFNAFIMRITFKELYDSWVEHYNSGEPFGIFG